MATEPYTAIGRVTKTHGLNGEVSVVFDDEASLVVREGLELLQDRTDPTRTKRHARVV